MIFNHLHCHTQFSLLDGAADISRMLKKAKADNMRACAITDHGNMFGVFKFVSEANKIGIKPIIGCEFYLVEDRTKKSFTREEKDVRYHQLMLAKNEEGYKNLMKLSSLGFMEGMYGKYPRIDKELVLKYHKGLIATTCCLGAEVPKAIIRKGEEEAEKIFKWWLDIFGEDYYIELQRHDIPEQRIVNEVLLKFAKKYNVKIIASNDSHYVDQTDYDAHDILLCINTGEKKSTPVVKEFVDEDIIGKGSRFGFYNDQFFFKNTEQMSLLFNDVPAAIDNTNEIVDKVENLSLEKSILLPNFPLPPGFASQEDYITHLAFEGARRRYKEITAEVETRINEELFTIKTMGFAGYFLIVSDFIKAGRDLGVYVGPGRGSAAGSVVAYCLGITNIEPMKYNLLFERFLNPERASMPDIDTDFDDAGRQKVIDYVVEKYGKNQVAQIITYGSMAAKMSIKDVARVLDLPLPDSLNLTSLVPDKPGTELKRVLHAPFDGEGSLKDKEDYNQVDLENIKKLREIYKKEDGLESIVLHQAEILEGSVRNTGVHAAGIIIAPSDLTDIIPIATSRDSELYLTQYEGNVIENAGVIKMDFLGLRTLTILKTALRLIEENKGVSIDLDNIPLDDQKTFELYKRGDTVGTFQFESGGMRQHLKDLKPDKFEDLIAMNALYRPGPMAYIPTYINRKHGREAVVYDLPEMEEHLKETYGITVYQEQVMLLSQKLGGFTKAQADYLRKAMGKKKKSELDKLKADFMAGATSKGHPEKVLEKIWSDWEAFASYAFNKSHSTCYAYLAFQTAYLKAHFPNEYMAAVLTHNQGNIDKVSFFMEESKRMGIPVLGPDVNESLLDFSVNQKGQIRFGLSAIKGVGEQPSLSIINERKKGGPFSSIFDLTKRVNLKNVNKRVLEPLALSGGFDCFSGSHRAQYFHTNAETEPSPIEKALKYGANLQANEAGGQASLFGGNNQISLAEPQLPKCEPWPRLLELKKEKEVIGMYISGHPLDDFKFEIRHFSNSDIKNTKLTKNKEVIIAAIVSRVDKRIDKQNRPWARVTVEDFDDTIEFTVFSQEYLQFEKFLVENRFLLIKGKMDTRWKTSDQLEFKPSIIEQLGDVRESKLKNVSLWVYLGQLTPVFTQRLNDVIAKFPGNCPLGFKVTMENENVSLDLISKKYRINPSNEFFKEIKEVGLLSYAINGSDFTPWEIVETKNMVPIEMDEMDIIIPNLIESE